MLHVLAVFILVGLARPRYVDANSSPNGSYTMGPWGTQLIPEPTIRVSSAVGRSHQLLPWAGAPYASAMMALFSS